MSLESELIIARRRLVQRLGLWRIAAVLLGLALLLVLAVQGESDGVGKKQVARVEVSGLITDDLKLQKLLKKLAKSDKVKAVVLRIDSPGGTTAGGEALYLRIRELSEKKPVVAVFGTVAASAAYMTGLACDRIFTRGSSITGSVGVLVQWPDLTDLMTKLGVNYEELKSGPLKATPNPFKRDDPKNYEPMRELVKDTFDWFVGLVKERRNVDVAAIPGLKDGRIYTGRQAVAYGLADEIGGEDEAIKWLEREKGIEKDLPVVDQESESAFSFSPLSSMAAALAGRLGLTGLAALLGPLDGVRHGSSNGLMSLWRPQLGAE
jgi:protease-4